MAEEIMRKLRDVQAWLTDHGARLDALTARVLDQETRIVTLEETVAGLIIPRVLPFERIGRSHSSPHEYKIYAEPVVGTPLTVQVEAETDREAIEKAERMFTTPLVKTEILSKALTAREKAFEELRLVAKVKPRKIEGASNPIKSSRWVLELYPDEIPVWADAIRVLEAQPLTERERSFMRSLDYYVGTERKVTIPMLSWLFVISRKYGITVPEVPYPRR